MRRVVILTVIAGLWALGCPTDGSEATDASIGTDVPGDSDATAWAPGQYTIDCSDGMCLVPAGPFMMGCNEALDDLCEPNEKPYHQVNVPAFRIDKFEVTVSDYQACMKAGACTAPNYDQAGADHPATSLGWDQAKTYCEWAGKRLCTESEWEKAARGTDGRIYPWGNETATCDYAMMYGDKKDGCETGTSAAVGSRPAGASPYGPMDMAGNGSEFVEDPYHADYTGAPSDGSAWEDGTGSGHVARGGAYGCIALQVRASFRYAWDLPDSPGAGLSVRCCKAP